MLKVLPYSVAAALAMVGFAQAQVEAPREVNQERGRGAQEREVETRAGNRTLDKTGVVNGAPRKGDAGKPVAAPTIGTAAGNASSQPAHAAAGDVHAQLNSQLADCILLHNQEEIDLAKFAWEHSQNAKVKEFAKMLIDDHQKFGEALNQYASHRKDATKESALLPNQGDVLPEIANKLPEVTRQISNDRVEVRVGYAGANHVNETLYQIDKEATQKCQEMSMNLLKNEKGAEFDKCFVGMQIGAHIGMMAHLQAAEQHVTGDFQKVLQDGSQSVSRHYEHAMTLRTELMGMQNQK